LEGRFPTLDATRIPKVKRSKVRVRGARGIPCQPNRAATLLVLMKIRSTKHDVDVVATRDVNEARHYEATAEAEAEA